MHLKLNVRCDLGLSKCEVGAVASRYLKPKPLTVAAIPVCHEINLTIVPFWRLHPGAVADVLMNRLCVKYSGTC